MTAPTVGFDSFVETSLFNLSICPYNAFTCLCSFFFDKLDVQPKFSLCFLITASSSSVFCYSYISFFCSGVSIAYFFFVCQQRSTPVTLFLLLFRVISDILAFSPLEVTLLFFAKGHTGKMYAVASKLSLIPTLLSQIFSKATHKSGSGLIILSSKYPTLVCCVGS